MVKISQRPEVKQDLTALINTKFTNGQWHQATISRLINQCVITGISTCFQCRCISMWHRLPSAKIISFESKSTERATRSALLCCHFWQVIKVQVLIFIQSSRSCSHASLFLSIFTNIYCIPEAETQPTTQSKLFAAIRLLIHCFLVEIMVRMQER